MEEVLQFLKDSKVYYIATMDDNQPRVRPFSGILGYNGKIYIPTSNKKNVFEQMTKNNKIEISSMAYGKWIRLTAEIEVDPSVEAKKAMLDAYGEALTRMYSLNDGKFEVFYLKNVTAKICSSTEEPKEITF